MGHFQGTVEELLEVSRSRGFRRPVGAWYTRVHHRTVAWRAWGDVKADFSSASLIGSCVVFTIGRNKVRLVTRIFYHSQKVFVLKVMSHEEYDKDQGKDECGCFQPPPTRKTGRNGVERKRRRR